jgi:alpha-galactosidase
MHDEWSVSYFKLDAINWETMPIGHRYDDTKTCIEAYKIGMTIIRESIGDSFILGGNSPMWPSIGMVHGMRITNDNTRRWGKFIRLIEECFPRNWMHGRFWINDPDTVLLQNKMVKVEGPDGKIVLTEGPITKNEFAVNAAYTMASGGMVLSGDDVSTLKEENVEMLRKMIPSVGVAAEFDGHNYTVCRAKISDEKTIIYVFNLEDEAKDIKVDLDGRYDVLDLFEDGHFGICEGEIAFDGFAPHYAKVLICKKA